VVAVVIVATLGASLFVLSGIFAQIVLACLVAFLLEPLIGWLHRKARFPKWLAILVVYLVVAVITFYAIFIIPVLVIDSLTQINFSEIAASVDDWLAGLADDLANITIFGTTIDLTPIVEAIQAGAPPSDPAATIGDFLFGAMSAFAGAFGLVFSTIGFILFTGLVAIYLSGGASRFAKSALNVFPERARPDAIYVGQQVNEVWDDYVRGTAVMMVLIGTTTALVTWLLGVPGALFLGLIAGLLECIPTFGPIISTVPAVIVALVQGSTRFVDMNNVVFALIVIVAYILIQQLESSILQPRIVGGAVILPPIIVLLAITAGLQVFGVLGAIVAVPVVATVRAINRFLWARAVPDSRVSIAEEEREHEPG
jgi:predicted PurR-regulated permease PerM